MAFCYSSLNGPRQVFRSRFGYLAFVYFAYGCPVAHLRERLAFFSWIAFAYFQTSVEHICLIETVLSHWIISLSICQYHVEFIRYVVSVKVEMAFLFFKIALAVLVPLLSIYFYYKRNVHFLLFQSIVVRKPQSSFITNTELSLLGNPNSPASEPVFLINPIIK